MRIINNTTTTLSAEAQSAIQNYAANAEVPGEELRLSLESEYPEGNVWNVADENGVIHFKFDDQDNIAF
jgi:hypothetical protein